MAIACITGATSGFGAATAEKFAKQGYDLIITGRRAERLQELQQHLISTYQVNISALNFDVQDKEATFTAFKGLPDSWKAIDVLINNAGLALGREPVNEGNVAKWETMIDTNIKGLLYVSKAVLPLMVARKKGHVINIGSVAGKLTYANGNVYCATKAAVDTLSQSMRIDLLPHHIKVTAIHPGAADTEFSLVRFDGDAATANAVYEGFTPLAAVDVADIVWYCASLPPNVCIDDLVVTPLNQANSIYFYKT